VSFIPVRIVPPEKPLGRLAFISTFTRNPLEVIPRAVYEDDFESGPGSGRAWISAPAMIKAVLLDRREAFRKITQIRLLGPLLGKGILTSEGADWKWQRQAAAPLFRAQDLKNFVPAFVHATQSLLGRWHASPADTVRPIDADMTRVTFEVISATLLPSAGEAVARAMTDSIRAMQRTGGWEQLYAAINAPTWMPRPGMISVWRAVTTLRASVVALLRERRARGGEAPDDLMRRLIAARDPESGQSMNDEQLVDNLLTFYLAGHETTARALTWTLYLLARSPEWTAALVDEIQSVTGGAEVSGENIDKLVLVQQVLKESMRLYPPVPIMSRQAIADVQIDGRAIAAGTSVLMPIYAIHRHLRRWDDPDAFDPTRFAADRADAISRYQYMPFGAGPRICIGMAFAMMEATAILVTLLQHATFAPADDREPVPVARVTLIPKGGMSLKVSWRRR
jgi:cytochrome P450